MVTFRVTWPAYLFSGFRTRQVLLAIVFKIHQDTIHKNFLYITVQHALFFAINTLTTPFIVGILEAAVNTIIFLAHIAIGHIFIKINQRNLRKRYLVLLSHKLYSNKKGKYYNHNSGISRRIGRIDLHKHSNNFYTPTPQNHEDTNSMNRTNCPYTAAPISGVYLLHNPHFHMSYTVETVGRLIRSELVVANMFLAINPPNKHLGKPQNKGCTKRTQVLTQY